MSVPVDPPQFNLDAFACPHCAAFARQRWFSLFPGGFAGTTDFSAHFQAAKCDRCDRWSIWHEESMIFPRGRTGVIPLEGMPASVLDLFEEARAVGMISPRSAAALLRLALQTLIDELEPGNKNLNEKIGALKARGLADDVVKAMDVVRVVGNNGVHPGEIDVNEDSAILPALFALVNVIVEQVVVRRSTVDALFAKLPPGALEAIARRDAPRA